MILDIATISALLIDFCRKAIQPCDLKSRLRNFMINMNISEVSQGNTRGQSRKWRMIHSQDDLHLTYNRTLVVFDVMHGIVTWICRYVIRFLAVTGVMHEADDAYSIRSTWSCYWLDQFLTLAFNAWILKKFSVFDTLLQNTRSRSCGGAPPHPYFLRTVKLR